MAFPYLLFVITFAGTVGTRLNKVTFGFLGEGVLTLIVVFGFLGWFYSARVIRSVALSFREKEFVEAARMVGSSNWRIIRSHILPHLVGPLIVLVTFNVAATSSPRRASRSSGSGSRSRREWGTLLADALQYKTARPILMVWPGLALLFTTLSFNLMGDGLRDAFDPRAPGDPRHPHARGKESHACQTAIGIACLRSRASLCSSLRRPRHRRRRAARRRRDDFGRRLHRPAAQLLR